MASHTCECGTTVEGADLESFGDAFIAHARSDHPDWHYPDVAVRNYAEATQRLTGPKERLGTIGEVVVHPVTEDRVDDWLAFFDHDGFADNPAWAACYCTEPHIVERGTDGSHDPEEPRTWQRRREIMIELLRSGRSFGYLAYVDGRPGGWVNASKRPEYALYRLGGGADPADVDVVGISCFVIAPPYRRHGLASRLLERVLADAPGRDVGWVEAYPFQDPEGDAKNFRGPRSLFEEHGFEHVETVGNYTVLRRGV
jgi:GNAT superfamily N-acetyltransferase